MPTEYQCPNCSAVIMPTALECIACRASFAEGSAWKPLTKEEGDSPPATAVDKTVAAIGIGLLAAIFFPVGSWVLHASTGGMYGSTFRTFSPALFIGLSYTATYLPPAIMAWVLLQHFKVMDRIPHRYRSTKLFGFGITLVLLYSVARALAATVPGGGAGFAVASFAPFILSPALASLVVAVMRLSFGFAKGQK
jgi:hypothetical protein